MNSLNLKSYSNAEKELEFVTACAKGCMHFVYNIAFM